MYSKFIKQILDRMMAIILLILLSPIIVILYIISRLSIGKPVFFITERAGKNGVPFTFYKFRSMLTIEEAGSDKDIDRITPFGNFLRKSSLDELPQLLNILKGEMSFIGPRPLLVRYNERYSEFQKQRLNVLPGITGLAQVNGRNAISWEDKFKMDVQYKENINFFLDAKIFFLTFFKIFNTKNINAENTTMEEFMG